LPSRLPLGGHFLPPSCPLKDPRHVACTQSPNTRFIRSRKPLGWLAPVKKYPLPAPAWVFCPPQGMESGDGKMAWRRPDTTPWESHQTQGRKGCSRPAKAAKSSWGNRPARIDSSKENRSVRRKPHAWWFASRCRALGKVKRGSTWRQLIRPATARLSSFAEKPERSLAGIALVVCPHRAPLD
jgi:hypothetical protein